MSPATYFACWTECVQLFMCTAQNLTRLCVQRRAAWSLAIVHILHLDMF